ncbi:hypothetical protein SAMN03159341_102165 [Paenibacillus sp. 1_12]|uniref:hypothetical protein n=1 Tax=Paenibacillus sp. 1_12 TaxID=1566278 RepID=UPI0008E3E6CB|nr:hypothetical protein [Paenibacillus sp. 1_12]SFK92204.1 hypothetical protein SAMN03159341_102165 [Paenibacillus sp. 1_12]
MNPGYLSWLLMIITMILFASGWKDLLLKSVPSKVILLFFVTWIIGTYLVIPLPLGTLAVWVPVLLLWVICILWRLPGALLSKLHIVSVGALMGSLSFFMQETVQLMPASIYGNMELVMALAIGVLAVTTIKLPSAQIAAVSIGLLLGEGYFLYISRRHFSMELGSLTLQDRWWLTLVVTRSLSIGLMYTLLAGKHGIIGMKNVIKASVKKISSKD